MHKPWITVETLALIRKRAELQLRKHSSAEALLVFSNCFKEIRKALRSDKRQWLKDKGETIIDIGRFVADPDFADDVALLGVSDSVEPNLHRIESSAEAVGLMINVGKTKNMGVKGKKPGASVHIAQKNVEILTGNHKGRYGTLIETENQSRLLIGREVLVGKKKNAGWFEILAGEKLRLKSSAEAQLVTVSSDERSVVADLVSTASNRSSAASDDESCECLGCKRRFDTARGCKVHEARFCKSKNSKSVEDSAS